jgi:hypothetical protein
VSARNQGGHGWSADDDAYWQEAAGLRREHPQWIIIWLASLKQFRAYRRMPGARRDTALTASTSEELAAKIAEAEQPSLPAPRDHDDQQ